MADGHGFCFIELSDYRQMRENVLEKEVR